MSDLLERLRTALADRYAVESEIGRGGMATVFLAEDLKHRRKVAIKVLHPELAAAVGPERFLREIEAVAGLTHPHVLPLHDSGEAEGLLYYTMPYVEGESLRDRLAREQQLPVDEAVRIACEVAEALEHAHRHGLVHRDVKPGNILLEEGHAVVADFGVARAVRGAGGEKMTATGLAVGTAAYMSPEQARGESTLDGRADVYSLGCVLYEMLAGEPPFTGGTPASITARKELEAAPRLGELRETVPEFVERAVDRALAKVPADRFNSAERFAAALSTPGRLERTRRKASWALPATLGVAAVAAMVWLLPRVTAPNTPDHLRSIAVLPFENRSSEEGSEAFTYGVHDNVLTQLSKIGSLTVISNSSVSRYAETTKTTSEIADELNVGTVLTGSVQRAGDRVQVNVRLIDAAAQRHIWAETYDQELTAASVLDIQVDVAKQIAHALQAELTPEVEARLAAPRPRDLEAYSLYLRGRQSWNQRTKEGFEAAIDYFGQAIHRDSAYAQAWAGLAEAYGLAAFWGYLPHEQALPVAREAAARAVELDASLAEAHTALAMVFHVEGNWEGRERELLRALELNPNYATAHHWYGTYLKQTGRPTEAVEELLRARQLDPLSGRIHTVLSEMLLRTRRYQEALEAADLAITLLPEYAGGYAMKALTLMALRRFDEVRPVTEKITELEPLSSWSWLPAWISFWERDYDSAVQETLDLIEANPDRGYEFVLGPIYTAQGRYAEAMSVWDSLIKPDPVDRAVLLKAYTYARGGNREEALAILDAVEESLAEPRWANGLAEAALVFGALGENDTAFELLEEAVELRASGLIYHRMGLWWLEVDPWADPLRDDPRFDRLIERINPR